MLSGRAPAALNMDEFYKAGYTDDKPPPSTHPLNVTVPGTAAGWVDTLEIFGSGKVRDIHSC